MTIVIIKRAHVFGFGKWIDKTIDFQDAAFICFYGKNEAGKSTLQQFMLYILFGLPPRKLSLYKPKYSSRIGGSLTVHFPDVGDVTIERVENDFRLLLPDGRVEENESYLQEHLHHLRRETYEEIYGFSALDLTRLHEMKKANLSDLLFSVGLTGSTTIYEVEKSLDKRLEELFKKSGRKPRINQQIKKMNELEKQLTLANKEVLSYREKVERQNELQVKRKEVLQTLHNKREILALREKIQQFLPQIRTYHEINRTLKDVNQSELSFPENGINRYEILKERIIKQQAELNTVENSIKHYTKEINELKEKIISPELQNELENVVELKGEMIQVKQKIEDLTEEINTLSIQMNEELKKLHLSEEMLESFDAPFYLESSWKQLIDDQKRLQIEKEHLEEERLLLNQKREKFLREKKQLEDQFVGFEQLKQMKRRREINEKNEKELAALNTLSQWEKGRKKQSFVGLILTSVLIVIFLLLGFLNENSSYSWIAVVAIGLFIVQTIFYHKNRSRLRELQTKISELKQIDESKNVIIDQEKEQEEIAKQLNAIIHSLKEVEIEWLQWEEKQSHFHLKEENFLRNVSAEREKYPFLENVDVSYWLQYLHQLMSLKEKLIKRTELQEFLTTLTNKIDKINFSVIKLGNKIGFANEQITFETIEKEQKNQEIYQQKLEQYENLKTDEEERSVLLKEEIRLTKEEINELFSLSMVTDEESYYKKAQQIEEIRQLQKTYEQLENQLFSIFPKEQVRQLAKEIPDELYLEREIIKLSSEISDLEAEKDSIEQQLAQLRVEIEQLESSDDYSHLIHLFEKEKEKLNQQAEDWATLKLAKSLLEKAKHRYQEKYFHDVINYTSQYFAYLTKNRYVRVFSPTDENSFQVEDESKLRYTVEELSKGTIDQLYVALRLAISKVMSEKFVVPLMIDDAFIHFDDDRAKLAINLLETIANEQQVIFYTCRKHFIDFVQKPNSLRIEC